MSDQLTVYSEPGNVSSLQGGEPRTGRRFELLQENWSPAARMIAGGAGAALMLAAMQTRGGMRTLLGVSGRRCLRALPPIAGCAACSASAIAASPC